MLRALGPSRPCTAAMYAEGSLTSVIFSVALYDQILRLYLLLCL